MHRLLSLALDGRLSVAGMSYATMTMTMAMTMDATMDRFWSGTILVVSGVRALCDVV